MAWKASTIKSWGEFLQWADKIFSSGQTYLFRGQPEDVDNLEPRYLRILNEVKESRRHIAYKIERQMVEDFFRTAALHLDEAPVRALVHMPLDTAIIQRWGIMQHYGSPTRLVDWTGSPFVAAYFAVTKNPESDGAIWCYRQNDLQETWLKGGVKAALGCWPVHMKAADYFYGRAVNGRSILHHFIHGSQTTRMAAQQGVFTVCTDVFEDHAVHLETVLGRKRNGDAYQRLRIRRRLKDEFIERLKLMNITGVSLFPGIDGLGRSIGEGARVRLLGAARRNVN